MMFRHIQRWCWLRSGHAQQILDKAPVGICLLVLRDGTFTTTYSNAKAVSILGYDPSGRTLEETLPTANTPIPEYNFETVANLYRVQLATKSKELHMIVEINTKQWGLRYFEQGCIVYGPNTLMVTFTDISDAYHLSIKDPLTGLFTRPYMTDSLVRAINQVGRGTSFTYLRIDLNKFKAVNDGAGHATGDKALRTAATRMVEGCREVDIIGRVGGDEFAILLQGEAAANVGTINRLSKLLCFDVVSDSATDDRVYPLSAAIGVTEIYPKDTPETVDYRADIQQLSAKKSGQIEYDANSVNSASKAPEADEKP